MFLFLKFKLTIIIKLLFKHLSNFKIYIINKVIELKGYDISKDIKFIENLESGITAEGLALKMGVSLGLIRAKLEVFF